MKDASKRRFLWKLLGKHETLNYIISNNLFKYTKQRHLYNSFVILFEKFVEFKEFNSNQQNEPPNLMLDIYNFQVIFVTECNPPNADYMFGKQGLLKGLVPRAFLELLD